MSGTFCHAGKAACAFGIIEYGKIVLHRNRAVGAGFRAYAAAYTADLAYAGDVFALTL